MKKIIAVLCVLFSSLCGFAQQEGLPETILFGKEEYSFGKIKNNTVYYYSPSNNLFSVQKYSKSKKQAEKEGKKCPGQDDSFVQVSVVTGDKGEFLEIKRKTRFSSFYCFIENFDPEMDYFSEICALNDFFAPATQPEKTSTVAPVKDVSSKSISSKSSINAAQVPGAIFFANEQFHLSSSNPRPGLLHSVYESARGNRLEISKDLDASYDELTDEELRAIAEQGDFAYGEAAKKCPSKGSAWVNFKKDQRVRMAIKGHSLNAYLGIKVAKNYTIRLFLNNPSSGVDYVGALCAVSL